jgi:hypothetical protein
MIDKIINNRWVQVSIILLVAFMFAFYLFSLSNGVVVKFANNNFYVDTSTGNVSAPNGTTMDLVFITKVRPIIGVQKFEYKYRTLHFCGNLLTSADPESAWVEVDVSQ